MGGGTGTGGLPDRKRSKLIVEIDLDPVPGWGHDPQSHQHLLQKFLNQTISHYNPTVTVICENCGRDHEGATHRCYFSLPDPPGTTRMAEIRKRLGGK